MNINKLSRSEMRNILGGRILQFTCYALKKDGSYGNTVIEYGDNANQAEASADFDAYSKELTDTYPYGIDCPDSSE